MCRLRCLISRLDLTLSSLALSSAVTYLLNKSFNFNDFPGPTTKFHEFPGLKYKILLNSMTFQVFHDLYEPCKLTGGGGGGRASYLKKKKNVRPCNPYPISPPRQIKVAIPRRKQELNCKPRIISVWKDQEFKRHVLVHEKT